MGSVVQFAAFFCICSLIQSVATHSNQNEDEKRNNKRLNPNSPTEGDFYFVGETVNGDNVKSGRAIHQSAWSKEDKEPTDSIEKKIDSQFSDESSIKKLFSYLLNVVHELKEDIFGIKEMTMFKKTTELPNAQDSTGDKDKQNEKEENHNVSKSVLTTENTELKNKKQPSTPNYITDYYRKNGIEFIDDEEKDDNLENFSDVSDDSSHKPDEGTSMQEVRKNNENERSFKCVKIKNKPGNYTFVIKKSTAIPTGQSKINDEVIEKKESGKCSDCDESTEKPTKTKQNTSKASGGEIENRTNAPSNSKRCKCMQKNNKNFANNENGKNKPTEKTFKSEEYRSKTKFIPQNEDSDHKESKTSNQDKIVDNTSPENNSKNKYGSEFGSEPDVQSTVLPSHNSQLDIFSGTENKNEPKGFGTPSGKQQEQSYFQKPEDKKQRQNNAKFSEDNGGINEQTTVSFQSHDLVLETPELKMTTEAYTSDTEINDSPKEPKEEESKIIPTQSIESNNENKQNSEINRKKTSASYYIGNTITPTTSENIMNLDKMNKNLLKNSSDKTGTNENDDSEKLRPSKQDKNDLETQKDDVTNQTKIEEVNGSESEKSLKNGRLIDSNLRNDTKESDYQLDSTTTSDSLSQDSNQEIQNYDNKESDKSLEVQENVQNIIKRTEMQDSPDQEYEYDEDTEDFDIWDDDDTQASDQNQDSEQDTNDGDHEKSDKINTGSAETVMTNESQIYRTTGYAMEKSEEQFDTFLEYFYKNSNNSFFQSLKNQSHGFSDD